MFAIPPRSPDINLIENIFHLVHKQLGQDALRNKIEKESFEGIFMSNKNYPEKLSSSYN